MQWIVMKMCPFLYFNCVKLSFASSLAHLNQQSHSKEEYLELSALGFAYMKMSEFVDWCNISSTVYDKEQVI